MNTITNRYGTFRLDADDNLVILSNTANLELIQQWLGPAFVQEQLRQVRSDLIRDKRKK